MADKKKFSDNRGLPVLNHENNLRIYLRMDDSVNMERSNDFIPGPIFKKLDIVCTK